LPGANVRNPILPCSAQDSYQGLLRSPRSASSGGGGPPACRRCEVWDVLRRWRAGAHAEVADVVAPPPCRHHPVQWWASRAQRDEMVGYGTSHDRPRKTQKKKPPLVIYSLELR
jgi:hypothetical protein